VQTLRRSAEPAEFYHPVEDLQGPQIDHRVFPYPGAGLRTNEKGAPVGRVCIGGSSKFARTAGVVPGLLVPARLEWGFGNNLTATAKGRA
jgi:hypothetical protein